MVKFGKHLEMEAVPEWRAAYCSYKQLKKALKKIKFEGELQRSRSAREGATGGLVRRLSLDSIARSRRRGNPKDFIRVHRRRMLDGAQVCETKLLQGAEPMVTPLERNFFAKLDEQLNKVDDFYRKKEAEFVERSEMLDKQMEALQEMQTILDHANSKANGDRNSDSESKQEEGSPAHDGALSPRPEADPSPRKTSKQSEDVIQIKTDSEGFSPNGSLSSPLQQMRFSLPPMGARAVISSLSQNFWDDLRQQLNLSASDSKQPHQSTVVSRKKVQYAAKMLRNAYIEFYRGLTLLKSYSSLNIVAFGKILKKYDKVTGRRASAIYLEAVEESAVHTSDKIAKLMERVELKFTAEFTQGDRRSAMRSLRPLPQKDSHVVTFFLGVFTGSITALLAGVGIALHMGGVHWKPTPQNPSYKESEPIFQVFSMLTLIALHMYLYGWNVYLWKKAHINYGFIFEFAPGKELQYREVLLLASGFATFIMGALVAHLALHISVHEKGSERPGAYIDVIPFVVVLDRVADSVIHGKDLSGCSYDDPDGC